MNEQQTDESEANGLLLGDDVFALSLKEISRACAMHADWVISLVEEGVLEPQGNSLADWRFSGECLGRARKVMRFQRDLGVNLSGAALAVELLDELQQVRRQVMLLEEQLKELGEDV